jgi:hypothetical protein
MLTLPGRLIDQDERTRQKPMRILVLGMCRTGTTSMAIALRKLGYTPYQMRNVLLDAQDLKLWQEAIDTTLLPASERPRNRAAYGKPEFDKLLAAYDVVMDIPACVFAKELVDAYPDAKVILTTRDYAAWEASMQESIWCLCTWRLFVFARYFGLTQMAPLMRLVHSVFRVHGGNAYGGQRAKEAFDRHYEMVRTLVPRERLLEIDPDEMSWGPLCAFLEKEVPKEGVPRMKDDRGMRQNLENAWWGIVQYLGLMMILPTAVVLLAIVVYNYIDAFREMRDEYILFPIGRYLKS